MKSPKEFEEARKIEELTESSFFDYQVAKKINGYLNDRYKNVKYLLTLIFTLIATFLGYFGIDGYQTAALIEKKQAEIDSLSRKMQVLNRSFDTLLSELKGEVNAKIEDIDKIKENMEENATKVSESSKLLHGNVNIMGSSVQSINDQWIFLKERAEQVAMVQHQIDDKLNEVNRALLEAKVKLAELNKDDLLKRISLLENTNDRLFSVYDDKMPQSIRFNDKQYNVLANEIKDNSCQLRLSSKVFDLKLGDNPIIIDDSKGIKIELLLISSLKESMFGKRTKSVTLRIFNDPT